MKYKAISRRNAVAGLASGAVLAGVAGCSGATGATCAGPEQLTAGQKAARGGRKYVEASNVEGQRCDNCEFFKSFDGTCGECAIDGLPANPAGYCTSWAAILEKSSDIQTRSERRA